MSVLEEKLTHLVRRFGSRVKSGLSPSFGDSLARALDWGSAQRMARVETVDKRGARFRVSQAYLGEEPALLFFGHTRRHNADVLRDAALCGYHSAVEWGVVTNLAETVVFNSHWVKDGGWFCFPALKPRELVQRSDILGGLTPDALGEGRIEKLVSRRQEPDQRLMPVDENLVNSLDAWRDEALKYSSAPNEVDAKLQNVFAQFFVLRAVEDRNLAPSIPRLESAISNQGEVRRGTLREIFKAAKSSIQSELFDTVPPDDLDQYILEGIIRDLYRPKDFPIANVSYNFAWIDADVLGRAYEKYLSTVLVPLRRQTLQLSLFEEPLHDVRRVSRRRAGGVYYTPSFIVRYLTSKALNGYFERTKRPTVDIPRLADISCGSGSFLTTAADALIRKLRSFDAQKNWGKELVAKRKLIGIDIDPKAVTLARLSLWLRLAEEPDPLPLPSLKRNVVCGDSLSPDTWKGLPQKYDIIIGNPPFMPRHAVTDWRRFRGSFRSATGRFDYSSLFVEKAVCLLERGGLLGLVVPNRILQNAYASPIRKFLTEETRLLAIVDFGSTEVFLGTSSYVALLCAEKEGLQKRQARVRVIHVKELPGRFPGVILARGALCSGPLKAGEVSAYDADHPEGGSAWTLLSESALRLRITLENEGEPLSSLASIFQGIKTGANDIFVVEPRDSCMARLCEVVNGLGDTLTVETALLRPVVYGSEIRRYDSTDPRRYLIYPYRRGQLIAEDEMRRAYGRTWKYLEAYGELLASRSGINAGSHRWYGLVRKREESWLEMPKLLIRDLAMRPAFAIDREGSVFLIGGIAIVPPDPVLLEPLLGFLNSRASASYLGQVSAAFRGGFRKFEPQNVGTIPIPGWVIEGGGFQDKLGRLVGQRLEAQLDEHELLRERIEGRIDRLISSRLGVDLDEI